MTFMDLADELQKIYDSEINVRIGWFWDCGIEVRLGDDMNGFLAEETVRSVADVIPWLQEAIARFYPESTYAKSLDTGIRARAANCLFLPPKTGAQVRCPHCGAPNASMSGMDELFIFVCSHCGETVEVTPTEADRGAQHLSNPLPGLCIVQTISIQHPDSPNAEVAGDVHGFAGVCFLLIPVVIAVCFDGHLDAWNKYIREVWVIAVVPDPFVIELHPVIFQD